MADQPKRIEKPQELDPLLNALREKRDREAPRFLLEVGHRAARLGKSVEDLLREDRRALRASTYPGPECFEPYEVEQYVEGRLAAGRLSHRDACAPCASLIAASVPGEQQVARLLDEVRQTAWTAAQEAELEAVGAERVPGSGRLKGAVAGSFGFVTQALAVAVPVVLAAWAVLVAFLLEGYLGGGPRLGHLMVGPALGYAALFLLAGVVAVVLAAFVGARFADRAGVYWRSGGALIAGVVFATAIGGSIGVQLTQGARGTEARLTLLQDRVEQMVATSWRVHGTSGSFPRFEAEGGPLSVTTSRHDREQAVYTARSAGVPGSLVARVRTDGGELYWQHAREQEQLATFLFGTVETTERGLVTLVDPSGASHTVRTAPEWTPPPRGGKIVAVLKPDGTTATSLHVTEQAAP